MQLSSDAPSFHPSLWLAVSPFHATRQPSPCPPPLVSFLRNVSLCVSCDVAFASETPRGVPRPNFRFPSYEATSHHRKPHVTSTHRQPRASPSSHQVPPRSTALLLPDPQPTRSLRRRLNADSHTFQRTKNDRHVTLFSDSTSPSAFISTASWLFAIALCLFHNVLMRVQESLSAIAETCALA